MRSRLIAGAIGASLLVPVLAALPADADVTRAFARKNGELSTGTVHIGSLYQFANKQGDQLFISAKTGCDPETEDSPDYYVPNLDTDQYGSSTGTSSFTDYNRCDTKLFDRTNGDGNSFGYINAGSGGYNIRGSFDNSARSVQWD